MQGKVNPKPAVMVKQHIQRISKIVSSKVAVPSPVCIRIRIMPQTITVGFHIMRISTHFMPVRAGMGMDAGPITGQRNAVVIYNAPLHGWIGGSGTEYLLEKLFVIKTTLPKGGLLQGYKPVLPTAPKDAGLHFVQAILSLPLLLPLKGYSYYLLPLKGSSYSFTLSLSKAISCFSCS